MRLFRKTHESRGGQAISEYVIMLAMFVGVATILLSLLGAFSAYGWRIVSLVGMEYP